VTIKKRGFLPLPRFLIFFDECIEKTTLEEWGGAYVGLRPQPHIPVIFSRLTFYQWSI
jgi:hypothetical protein